MGRGHQLEFDTRREGRLRRIGGAVEQLDLIRHQRGQRRPAAADKHILYFETVFIEKMERKSKNRSLAGRLLGGMAS